ncbi:MAG: carbohydrate kinase family protein [Chloroflexota bacterium]|mgnify:CR=1 FL=1|nr:MAG: carbohydrate kinase family protein [Chloroflexota bacterium]
MNVILTGSIAYDYLMRFPGRFSEHLLGDQLHQVSLSFLVEDMTKHWGGVAANIAYTMALLGMRPRLMGTVGRDFGDYRAWLESVGVDTSTVRQIDDVFTASFFANTDLDNNQIASFYSGAMAYARDYRLKDALDTDPDLVIISPNDPQAMLNLAAECRERGLKFIYDPSQQVPRLNGDELLQSMEGAYAMIVNGYEAEIISKKTGKSIDALCDELEILVITHGGKGSTIYHQGEQISIPVFPPKEIKDPTGGGDAYRAGLIRGIAAGWPLKLAGQCGALCATYALEHVGTQNHRFTIEEFVARFRTQFDDEGLLSSLLEMDSVTTAQR